jgi:hypothetical protein
VRDKHKVFTANNDISLRPTENCYGFQLKLTFFMNTCLSAMRLLLRIQQLFSMEPAGKNTHFSFILPLDFTV